MTDETVAESYDRIKRELRERVIQDTLAMERRIREAARKADDAGLAQQLEQFTDGRGFYVV